MFLRAVLGLFCIFFLFVLNRICTTQERPTGDRSLSAPFPRHNCDTRWPEGSAHRTARLRLHNVPEAAPPSPGPGEEPGCASAPSDPALTDGEEQNTGDKAAGAHAEVINTDAHLGRPQREQGGGDDGNHWAGRAGQGHEKHR